jgi:xanthine dehydrogenase accessory factor
MRELNETLAAWQSEGQGIGRAIVVRTFGSAPRPEGAVMLVADDGRLAGSVSGGCVEGAAFEEVERARRTGRSRVIRTASATSRPGTSASPVAAPSMS